MRVAVPDSVKAWVKEQLAAGYDTKTLKAELRKQGWGDDAVAELFPAAEPAPPAAQGEDELLLATQPVGAEPEPPAAYPEPPYGAEQPAPKQSIVPMLLAVLIVVGMVGGYYYFFMMAPAPSGGNDDTHKPGIGDAIAGYGGGEKYWSAARVSFIAGEGIYATELLSEGGATALAFFCEGSDLELSGYCRENFTAEPFPSDAFNCSEESVRATDDATVRLEFCCDEEGSCVVGLSAAAFNASPSASPSPGANKTEEITKEGALELFKAASGANGTDAVELRLNSTVMSDLKSNRYLSIEGNFACSPLMKSGDTLWVVRTEGLIELEGNRTLNGFLVNKKTGDTCLAYYNADGYKCALQNKKEICEVITLRDAVIEALSGAEGKTGFGSLGEVVFTKGEEFNSASLGSAVNHSSVIFYCSGFNVSKVPDPGWCESLAAAAFDSKSSFNCTEDRLAVKGNYKAEVTFCTNGTAALLALYANATPFAAPEPAVPECAAIVGAYEPSLKVQNGTNMALAQNCSAAVKHNGTAIDAGLQVISGKLYFDEDVCVPKGSALEIQCGSIPLYTRGLDQVLVELGANPAELVVYAVP